VCIVDSLRWARQPHHAVDSCGVVQRLDGSLQSTDLLRRQDALGVGCELDSQLLIAQRILRAPTVIAHARLTNRAVAQPGAQDRRELVRKQTVAFLVGHAANAGRQIYSVSQKE
jgi:hypothetical protein